MPGARLDRALNWIRMITIYYLLITQYIFLYKIEIIVVVLLQSAYMLQLQREALIRDQFRAQCYGNGITYFIYRDTVFQFYHYQYSKISIKLQSPR